MNAKIILQRLATGGRIEDGADCGPPSIRKDLRPFCISSTNRLAAET